MAKRLTRQERMAKLQKDNPSIIQAVVEEYEVCPTRIPELNELLPGGIVKGKVALFYGTPSSGKSSSCVELIADEMKKDKDHVCLLIPAERGDDLAYYSDLGLDMKRTNIMIRDQYILEDVMEDIKGILQEGLVDSILIDSWDGLVGFKEMYTADKKEKEATKDTVAAKAAGASKMWKRIKGLIATNKTLFLVVAQVRTKGIGTYVTSIGYSGGKHLAA